MRGTLLTLAVAMMLAVVPAADALSAPLSLAVPPASFINHHVSSVKELTREVTLDRQVQHRLSKHFHMSGPKIVSYIKNHLVLKRLSVAGRYQVYCVSPSGREYVITSRLPVGTPVFVLRSNGQPVLKLACGNPMVAMLPNFPVTPTPVPQPIPAPQLASSETPYGTPTPTPTTLVASAPPTLMNVGPGELVITKISPAPIATLTSHGGPGLGLLAGIPILAGLFGGHGGSTPNTPTGTTGTPTGTTGTIPPPGTTGTTGTTSGAVPEPGPTQIFGVGGVALAMLFAQARMRMTKRRGR